MNTHPHIQPIQLSLAELSTLGELAEESGTPWGAWRDGERLYAVFGGELHPLEQLDRKGIKAKVEATDKTLGVTLEDERGSSLVWDVRALRFRPLASEDQHQRTLWPSWGERGWRWSPAYSLCVSIKDGRGYLGRREPLDTQKRFGGLGITSDKLGLNTARRLEDQLLLEIIGDALTRPNTPLEPHLEEVESFERWRDRVEEVVEGCRQGLWDKIVLARALRRDCAAGSHWSGAQLWRICCEESDEHEVPFILAPSSHERFVGRSPERLFTLKRGRVETHALAGTRVMGASLSDEHKEPESLARDDLKRELYQSAKDLKEHEHVVSWIRGQLTPLCDHVDIGELGIKSAGHLIHLETPISGALAAGTSIEDLLGQLHPTPALGGAPRAEALEYLERVEKMERGGYAAPWSWTDGRGDTTAVVGIRAALLSGPHATLFAGAGIVEGSTARSEWLETEAKADVIGRLLKRSEREGLPNLHREDTLPQRSLRRTLRFIKRLVDAGVVGAVISPGSRNTPLALAIDAHLDIQVSVDERSAAFTALGWAKATGRPVLLCCTSGSAAAHYLPALTEAYYAGAPLLVLTADRPPRLRGRGAPQTMWQHQLYGHHVKWSAELPEEIESELSPPTLDALWRVLGERALRIAMSGARGPVHLNIPFEEPLWDERCESLLVDVTSHEIPAPVSLSLSLERDILTHRDELPTALDLSAECGMICCGPLSPAESTKVGRVLSRLSAYTGWPIITEGASQLRGLSEEESSLDLLARLTHHEHSGCARDRLYLPLPQEVQVILFVGGHTHSRAIRSWLGKTQATCLWIGESPEVPDPLYLGVSSLGEGLNAGVMQLMSALPSGAISPRQTTWRQRWSRWREVAHHAHRVGLERASSRLWGGRIGQTLINALEKRDLVPDPQASPTQVDLIVASSMAFRDHDLTWRPEPSSPLASARVWVNRGVNGIDGTFSTALGIARADDQQTRTLARESHSHAQRHDLDNMSSNTASSSAPIIIWLGDLAAHHDAQGLHALCRWHALNMCSRPVIILLINNAGGGIFQHLPIRGSARFHELFVTSNQRIVSGDAESEWAELARWAGARYMYVDDQAPLEAAIAESCGLASVSLIEARVDAALDKRAHQEYWDAAHDAIIYRSSVEEERV